MTVAFPDHVRLCFLVECSVTQSKLEHTLLFDWCYLEMVPSKLCLCLCLI